MILAAPGCRFELSIVRYQFGEAEDYYDRNWLVVRITAERGNARWGGEDPCLLTWEAEELAAWLSGLAGETGAPASEIDFMEPELSFRVAGNCDDGIDLRIGTGYALADGSGVSSRDRGSVELAIKVSRTQLRGAADDLAAELRKWPKR